jgi:hypothetical protein
MEIKCREKRYQWGINFLLVILGFLAGVLFETERIKTQVVTNTVEIRILKESLSDIQEKLDMIIRERSPGHN